ncbi:MAG: lysophospholipid acyltransferase family protein [Myxococcota bacterium]
MARRLYSGLFWAFLTLSSILLFPVAVAIWVLTLPFDPRRRLLHRFTCFWASLYTWLNPVWPVTVVGREKFDADRATVMVANHLSLLDILVLFRTFTHFKWVSKVENFRIPFVGWNMSLNGYIKLKRGSRASAIRMFEECERTLALGNSIMMFPEGTRSPTGRMRDFKTGAFELALRTRSPVQPILIRGTADALPKQGFVLQGRHQIHITVLDPIPPESFAHLSSEELTERVRTQMADALGEPAAERAREGGGHAAWESGRS